MLDCGWLMCFYLFRMDWELSSDQLLVTLKFYLNTILKIIAKFKVSQDLWLKLSVTFSYICKI